MVIEKAPAGLQRFLVGNQQTSDIQPSGHIENIFAHLTCGQRRGYAADLIKTHQLTDIKRGVKRGRAVGFHGVNRNMAKLMFLQPLSDAGQHASATNGKDHRIRLYPFADELIHDCADAPPQKWMIKGMHTDDVINAMIRGGEKNDLTRWLQPEFLSLVPAIIPSSNSPLGHID